MSEPSVVHRVYAVPRAGGEAGDYEDAATLQVDDWPICAAVADGATESVFARLWANTLVDLLVDGGATTEADFATVVAEGQRTWQASVARRGEKQPWYVTAKAAEGAYATVMGLSVHLDGSWRAVSVGDCCLFHFREGTVQRVWPMDTPDAFTNRPSLLPSRPGASVPASSTLSGTWAAGDAFALMTDAVAAWLLRCREREKGIGDLLEGDPEAFQQRVATARERGDLRNDDVTLLVLEL